MCLRLAVQHKETAILSFLCRSVTIVQVHTRILSIIHIGLLHLPLDTFLLSPWALIFFWVFAEYLSSQQSSPTESSPVLVGLNRSWGRTQMSRNSGISPRRPGLIGVTPNLQSHIPGNASSQRTLRFHLLGLFLSV